VKHYRMKSDCPPIPAAVLAEWFWEVHMDWWNMAGQQLCGRGKQMNALLHGWTRGRRGPTDQLEHYVIAKFEEFLRDCFEEVTIPENSAQSG
jgi:hypothetical protein